MNLHGNTSINFTQPKTLVLSADDINEIVKRIGIDAIMDSLIERLTIAFRNFDTRITAIPARAGFHYKEPDLGLIEWMPLHENEKEVVIKIVGYHPYNPDKRQLPTILSTISSYDTKTGHLKTIMDGVFLTALRTGAASAVASKFLAKADSSVLGLIGCGAQAVTQLHALSRSFNIQKVLYTDKDLKTQASFEKRVEILQLDIELITANIKEIVQDADIICTATSIDVGAGPLFKNLKTKEHLHINAVGSDFPGKIELPLDLLMKSLVCPDFLEQAIVEGECQQLKSDDIGPDLYECIQNAHAYESAKKMRTVFDSTGLSLEDQVVMDLFLEYALDMDLGTKMAIENVSTDAKSPYAFLTNKKEVQREDLLNTL